MLLKKLAVAGILSLLQNALLAQGCSDAGFCTIGNFNAIHNKSDKYTGYKNEADLSYIIATHSKYERFHQLQVNYRLVKKNGAFYEIRLPFNTAKNINNKVSNSGIGDGTFTYNNAIKKMEYSLGLRISFSSANKGDNKSMIPYPMYLQSGLGTTDLLGVVNYNILQFLSIGTGVQVPVIQYNMHEIFIDSTQFVKGKDYRRQPDALLKLTAHYATGKLKISSGLITIFHLANDFYKTSQSKYILQNSEGTTVNFNIQIAYAFAKNITFDFLYAEPLVTRANIPDGLARSRIYAPKFIFSF